METKIATSVNQSKTLIELGIDVNTADMHWHHYIIDNTYELSAHKIEDIRVYDNPNEIPAWSLSALLSLIKPVNENSYTIQGTLDGGAIISFEEVTSVMFQESNILDAAFEMVCYLLENKIIK